MKYILMLCALMFACGDGINSPTLDAGSCEMDPGPEYPNGSACEGDEVCESGLCKHTLMAHPLLQAPDYYLGGGLCTETCWIEQEKETAKEQVQGSCDLGQYCVGYNQGQRHCFPECQTDNDCRVDEGWECHCVDFEARCGTELAINVCVYVQN
jgi:hypothetical protein